MLFTGTGSTWLGDETKDISLEQLGRKEQQNFDHGRPKSRTWFAVLTLRQVPLKLSCGTTWSIGMVIPGVKTTS